MIYWLYRINLELKLLGGSFYEILRDMEILKVFRH